MNLYSNKQKWKIVLLIFALILVGASLFISNTIVTKVSERETDRARQWADAIKKKIELVRLTNNTFSKLRENERKKMELWIDATKEVSKSTSPDIQMSYEFPLKIISENTDIPVIVIDNEKTVSGYRNLDLDTSVFRQRYPNITNRELQNKIDDSLLVMTEKWVEAHPSFTIEVFEGLFLSYFYSDSKEIVRLEKERDSLLLAFNNELINNKNLIPVLLLDSETNDVIGSNIDSYNLSSDLPALITELRAQNEPISFDFEEGQKYILYYDNSPELKQLQYFPYIQFLVIGLFTIIAYLIFSTFRKAEQNQVWAGMAKETAHQLGTPLSSLMAWVQLLEAQGVDPMVTTEMQKDVDRLEKVTDRFSKIGSQAKMDLVNVSKTVQDIANYLKPRISEKVEFTIDADETIQCLHNPSLIEWVVENISKNAVDAMEGKGKLQITVHKSADWVHIDIKDSGKGIPLNQFKRIFEPGYSTKKRGWGLGLSLVKRIVKEYHKGKVFVLDSQVDVGTTFRISLPIND